MKRLLVCLGLFYGCLGINSGAFAQARSIRSFVESKDRWMQLVGANWKLEGRYAFIGDDTMKFVNCSMPFYFGTDVSRPPGRFSNLEVTGKITRRDGKLVFVIDSIRPRPNDMQHLVFEKSKIDIDNAEDFYDLANWAAKRGKFYEDEELLNTSQDLQRSGMEIEFRNLKPTDRVGMSNLLQKAKEFELDEKLIEEFLHDAYWGRFLYMRDKEPATDPSEYGGLMVSLAKDLAGARRPLKQFEEETANVYYAEPTKRYQSANKEERRQLERLFYVRVATVQLVGNADESGKNGLEIAEQLEQEIPERKKLIDQYTRAGLKFQSDRVPVMTRQEMLEFASLYQKRGDQANVIKTKQSWLKAREGLYRDDGARGLVDLAEEWIQLLDDRETAAKYYVEAWRQNSQYPLAADWLRDNGYALHAGNWIPADLVPETMESAIQKAIREGRIQEGMTTEQVKITMGVDPDSMIRFAKSGEIEEFWIYRSAKITITFSWKLGEEATTVKKVSPLATEYRR